MPIFKAVEVERASRKPTGRVERLEVEGRGRDEAIAALVARLGIRAEEVRADPTRTLLQIGGSLWTLVKVEPEQAGDESPSLRRAAAKHRHVR